MNQAPAYQMYAGDWLKSRSVRMMTDYQRGWYIQLLNEAWDGQPQCMLPPDDATLQVLAGVSELTRSQPDFNARWTAVKRMFRQHGDYVVNDRQMEELAKQDARREDASRAGRQSAKAREENRRRLDALKQARIANACSTVVQRSLSEGCNSVPTEVQREGNGNPTLQSSVFSLQTPGFPKGDAGEVYDMVPAYPEDPPGEQKEEKTEDHPGRPKTIEGRAAKLSAYVTRAINQINGVPTNYNRPELCHAMIEVGKGEDFDNVVKYFLDLVFGYAEYREELRQPIKINWLHREWEDRLAQLRAIHQQKTGSARSIADDLGAKWGHLMAKQGAEQ
jgi:uncharacterized protein YdaU (DUF1376 family)